MRFISGRSMLAESAADAEDGEAPGGAEQQTPAGVLLADSGRILSDAGGLRAPQAPSGPCGALVCGLLASRRGESFGKPHVEQKGRSRSGPALLLDARGPGDMVPWPPEAETTAATPRRGYFASIQPLSASMILRAWSSLEMVNLLCCLYSPLIFL